MLDSTPSRAWHSLLMTAGFICIMAAGLLPVQGKRITVWYRIYIASVIIGCILMTLAVSMVFAVPSLSAMPSAFLLHAVPGVLLAPTLLITLLPALLRSRVAGSRKARVRTAHLWMGRIFIAFVVINILPGLTAVGLFFPGLL